MGSLFSKPEPEPGETPLTAWQTLLHKKIQKIPLVVTPEWDARLQPYKYESLSRPHEQIHLLSFDRTTNCRVATLQMKQTSLSEARHKYVAVSYRWDSESAPRRRLRVRTASQKAESTVAVTRVVHSMLGRVIAASGNKGGIWIDQVCIDQSPNKKKEKSEQVKIMHEIYASASRVFVWLGDELKDLPFSRVCVFGESHDIEDYPDLFNYTTEDLAVFSGDLQWSSLNTNADVFRLLRGILILVSMVQQDWFKRVWIIQELCYGKEVSVIFGDLMIPWDVLIELVYNAKRLFEAEDERTGEYDPLDEETIWEFREIFRKAYYVIHRYDSIRERIQECQNSRKRRPSLEQNLLSFANNKATDNRDNIFALLAISSRRTQPDDAPNYEQVEGEVYINTMKKQLEIRRGQELLACAGRPRTASEPYPSWVPDFSTNYISRAPFRNRKTYNVFKGVKCSRLFIRYIPECYFTFGSLPHVVEFRGCLVDKVHDVEHFELSFMDGYNIFIETLRRLLEKIKTWWSDGVSPLYEENEYEVFWRMLVGDEIGGCKPKFSRDALRWTLIIGQHHDDGEENESDEEYEEHENLDDSNGDSEENESDEGYEEHENLDDSNGDSEDDLDSQDLFYALPDSIDVMLNSGQNVTQSLYKFIKSLYPEITSDEDIISSGYLFRTVNGYFGISPDIVQVEKGDEIWFLSRCKTPFVLQPVCGRRKKVAECYRLHGTAYVHGIMRGEFFNERRTWDSLYIA